MADMMNFPKRWEDFLHDYEFEDARRIYTNGSRLIPAFRVKQMMEHYAPVRHGRWEDSTDEWFGTDVYTCSKCRESYVLVEGTPKENLWHYCPNCGCRMDGGDDE